MDAKSFYRDFLLTLGYRVWAERYVFAADAWRKTISAQQIATVTQTTAANAQKLLGQIVGPQNAQKGNNTVKQMLSPNKPRRKRQS